MGLSGGRRRHGEAGRRLTKGLRVFRKILTVVIAALGLAVAAAGPASASDSASTSDSCGAVYFYSDGDTFKFLDTCSDGHGVLARSR